MEGKVSNIWKTKVQELQSEIETLKREIKDWGAKERRWHKLEKELEDKLEKKRNKIKEKLEEQRKFYISKLDALKLQIVDKNMELFDMKTQVQRGR